MCGHPGSMAQMRAMWLRHMCKPSPHANKLQLHTLLAIFRAKAVFPRANTSPLSQHGAVLIPVQTVPVLAVLHSSHCVIVHDHIHPELAHCIRPQNHTPGCNSDSMSKFTVPSHSPQLQDSCYRHPRPGLIALVCCALPTTRP